MKSIGKCVRALGVESTTEIIKKVGELGKHFAAYSDYHGTWRAPDAVLVAPKYHLTCSRCPDGIVIVVCALGVAYNGELAVVSNARATISTGNCHILFYSWWNLKHSFQYLNTQSKPAHKLIYPYVDQPAP